MKQFLILLSLASMGQAAERPAFLEKAVAIEGRRPLKSWLALLVKEGVPVRIDERGLRTAGLEHLLERDIPMPGPGNYQVETVLDLLAAHLWAGDYCADYRVQENGIELFVRPLRWEMPYDSKSAADRLYLAKLKATQVDLDLGIDANTPLKDALEFLADRYDVEIFFHEGAFQFLDRDPIGEMPVELGPTTDRNLDEVLRLLLDQVGADRLVRPDHVLIVPRLPPLSADRRLSKAHAEAAWEELGSGEAGEVFAASRALWADHAGALTFFRERLRPAAPLEPNALMRLLADLDDNDFQVREKAAGQLELASERIEHYLEAILADKPALEVRRRIEQIQDRRNRQHRRLSQAVLLLEAMKTAESRQLLETLKKGEPRAHLTWAAAAALNRLDGRPWMEPLFEPRLLEEPYRIEQPRHPHECPFPDLASKRR